MHDSFWVIGAEVNQQNAGRAIEEIRNEIRTLQQELMPVDELEVAKNYFIGSWQSENSTLFSVADKVKSRFLWALPDQYYTNLLTHVRNITPAQIQKAANTHFGTSDLLEVQVG
jgi:predicted Zn-dependent peptidase